MGETREKSSVWVVLASVAVVALAGVTLRVERPASSRAGIPRERQLAQRVERARLHAEWRERRGLPPPGAIHAESASVAVSPP